MIMLPLNKFVIRMSSCLCKLHVIVWIINIRVFSLLNFVFWKLSLNVPNILIVYFWNGFTIRWNECINDRSDVDLWPCNANLWKGPLHMKRHFDRVNTCVNRNYTGNLVHAPIIQHMFALFIINLPFLWYHSCKVRQRKGLAADAGLCQRNDATCATGLRHISMTIICVVYFVDRSCCCSFCRSSR